MLGFFIASFCENRKLHDTWHCPCQIAQSVTIPAELPFLSIAYRQANCSVGVSMGCNTNPSYGCENWFEGRIRVLWQAADMVVAYWAVFPF